MKKNKINSIAFKSMSIKARLANLLRKELYEYSTNEWDIKYRGKKKLTDEDKIRLFNLFFVETKAMHNELNAYKEKRQYKAEIQRLREERKKVGEAK